MIQTAERNPNENDFQLMCQIIEAEERDKLSLLNALTIDNNYETERNSRLCIKTRSSNR